MKIVIIGLGSMGKRRLRLLKLNFPNINIIGVDNNEDRLKNVEEDYGIDCYKSLEEINGDVDCAFVCTSPLSHAKIINKCLEREMHVFSEINLISDSYETNIYSAGKRNKVLFLSSTMLYRAELQLIGEKLIERGSCAYQYHTGQYLPDWHPWEDVNSFFASNRDTNGCRELLAIELPWLDKVFGKIEKVNVLTRKLMRLKFDFPDTYFIQIEHAGGNIGSVVIDVVSRQAVRRLEVFNEDIYIRWDGTPDTLYEKDIVTGELKQIPTGTYIHQEGYADSINEYAYQKEIEDFFGAVKGKKEPLYSFEKDLEILNLIDKIERTWK